MNDQLQIEIYRAMTRPDFYPHDVSTIEQRETHISKVFLTGKYAYKIKKPVYLEFLDFTTLEKRKYYCEQEFALNKRLSDNIYLDVVPITLKKDRYHLAGPGEPVEYAVKMRQLPEKFSMLQLLRRGELNGDSVVDLARTLAKFYQHTSTGDNINNLGTWSTIWTNTEENFSQTEQFAGNLLGERMFQIIQAATRSFLIRRKALFDRRVDQEKIRDCHGDLRLGHIYFCKGIQIIDCIEFNERFRYTDITSDLAFLAMDLDYEGHSQVAQDLIKSFLDYTKDEEMLVLLDFYKCYRAFVRAKVNCFCLQKTDVATSKRNKLLRETRRYLSLAYRYAVQFTRPTVWVVCGLSAAGKTTIANMIAKILSLGILGSDVVRKKLFGMPLYESQDLPFEKGIYSKASTALVYGKLLMLAQEEIEKGNSVILDATFSTRHQRDEALRLARNMDANIIFVECAASNETLKKRLYIRDASTIISDARLHHFKQLRARFESISELPDEKHICINTDKPLEEGMRQILSHDYALLSNQTVRSIKHWESNSLNVAESP
jgi:aminoglycoside phosphotransferase family enzyme/predicted kinase